MRMIKRLHLDKVGFAQGLGRFAAIGYAGIAIIFGRSAYHPNEG